MMVRFSEEDEAWIAEQAADEGVDNATFVRMLVNRLRRGRPALMRDALAARPVAAAPAPLFREPITMEPDSMEIDPPVDPAVDQLLEQRLAGLGDGASEDDDPLPQSGNGAAVSHRHIPRQQYNPGRRN